MTSISSIYSTEIKETSFGKIIPIFLLKSMINKTVNVVLAPLSFDRKHLHFSNFRFMLQHPVIAKNAGGKE